MNRTRQSLGIAILLALPLVGCAPATAIPAIPATQPPAETSAPIYWPADEWPSSTPEEQGMDSQTLAEMVAHIQAEQLDIHGLLVVRNSSLVTEIYGHPYTAGQKHWAASVTKSVLSALVGIAIQRGELVDVHQSPWSLFPNQDIANQDENKQKISLEDLLTMTSGLDCDDNPSPGQPVMEESADWVDFVLDLPMVATPGTRYNYCSGVTQVLSAALQRATGMSAREYANLVLFPPLGIAQLPEAGWPADPQGVTVGGYELSLTPREMAKFGFLYLNKGRWDDTQVIPVDWVSASTTWHVDKGDGLGYGYLWHIDPGGQAYAALGRAGQGIFVYPSRNLVVVFTAGVPFREQDDLAPLVELLNEYILPAVKSDRPLPVNPAALNRLQDGIQALARPRRDLQPLPGLAAEISGRFFTFDENPLGWKNMALTFSAGQAEALVTFDGIHQVVIGLDNLYRVQEDEDGLFPDGLRGRWEDESTFVIDQAWIGKMTQYTYTLRFTAERTLRMTRVEKYTGEEITLRGTVCAECK